MYNVFFIFYLFFFFNCIFLISFNMVDQNSSNALFVTKFNLRKRFFYFLCQIWRRSYDVPPPALEEGDSRCASGQKAYAVSRNLHIALFWFIFFFFFFFFFFLRGIHQKLLFIRRKNVVRILDIKLKDLNIFFNVRIQNKFINCIDWSIVKDK